MRIDALKTDGRALIFITITLLLTLPASAADSSYSYSIHLNPFPRYFGKVPVGSSAIKSEIISTSGWKKVILIGGSVTGTGFWLKYHPPFSYTVPAGTKVASRLKFAPISAGYVAGSLPSALGATPDLDSIVSAIEYVLSAGASQQVNFSVTSGAYVDYGLAKRGGIYAC